MKIRTKIASWIIFSGYFCILLVSLVALSIYTKDIRNNALEMGDTLSNATSHVISAYFDARKSEISMLASLPLIKTMDWQQIKPFLLEQQASLGHYEKMILGLANEDANNYITTEGNPYFGGLSSHDNKSPSAKLHTMKLRDYWQYTVRDNVNAEPRTYVSPPIISFVTGTKLVVIASTILSDEPKKVLGLLGGTLDWHEMEKLFDSVGEVLLSRFEGTAKFFLVSRDGTYFYHFDNNKSLHLKTNERGEFFLNEVGEKIEVGFKVTEEKVSELAEAGRQLLAKKSGHVLVTFPEINQKEYLFYLPVSGTDFGLGIFVPEHVALKALYSFYGLVLCFAGFGMVLTALITLFVSRVAIKPIYKISQVAKSITEGQANTRLDYTEDDELGSLASAFNKMVDEQQRHIELTLDAHDRMFAILDGLDAMIYVADLNTYELLYVNQYVKRIFGDITGKICWQTIQANQTGPCPFCTNSYLLNDDGLPATPYRWECKNTFNGNTYLCVDRAIKWVDGRYVRLEIATDVTQQKEAEKQIRKLAAVIEHSDAAVFLCNKDTHIEYINKVGRQMLSVQDNITALPYSIISFIASPQDQEISSAIASGKEWHGQAAILHKDGSKLPVDINTFAVFNENGEFISMAMAARDISERLKVEEDLRQAQKMEAIGTLAGGIAHDFNNILMALMGYAELALGLCRQGDDDKLKMYLDHILKSSYRAANLVKQILTFSRKLDTTTFQLQLQPLVKETIKMLRNTIPTTVHISTDIDASCPMVMADAGQMQQVLMNLCVNAVHAMQEKGRLKVELKPVYLEPADMNGLRDLESGDYVRLSVEDDGCGMTPDVMARIFEPYFTTKPVGKGTGLGLATTLGIVKKHKGAITVSSEKGKGSVFHVYIPAVKLQSLPLNADAKANEADFSRFRAMKKAVLVVDDEASIREIVTALLDKVGWEYEVCTSGLEGFKAFEKAPGRFDLIISDYAMPEMSGLEMFLRVRKIKADMPFILISGYNSLVDEENAKKMGINYYLKKPFSVSAFCEALNEIF